MSGPTPPPPAARNRLNLIEQLSADAVASDYAGGGDAPRARSRRQQWVVVATAVGLAGFVLALGISSRVVDAPAVDGQRAALRERIAAATTAQDGLTGDLEQIRAQVEAARQANLEATAAGRLLAERIATLELVTGYAAATGPGVVVTLADRPERDGGDGIDAGDDLTKVLDSDIQTVVNGLWSTGAEAIAVNGQRLTAQSAIRSAAGAILVNYRPLTPPYAIEAIGPDSMEADFLASPAADDLRGLSERYGIGFDAEPADTLTLPAATTSLPDQATVIKGKEGDGS